MADKKDSLCGTLAGDVAHNESHCDNPISLDEIESGLWLGSFTAATDIETLKKQHITYILTLDICPLPVRITELPFLTTKYIQVSDTPKDDLLIHFDECFNFIAEALSNKAVILVHCYYGVSRSATVVIAYIMRKYRLSVTPTIERVKSKRIFVHPNVGFMMQLRLFHKMGWKIDANHEKYKLYRLRLAADKVRKAKILPQNCMDLVKPDPGLIQSNPEPIVYRCKKCRRIVAAKSNCITHTPMSLKQPDSLQNCTQAEVHAQPNQSNTVTEHFTNAQMRTDSFDNSDTKSFGEGVAAAQPRCQEIIFIEPLIWMHDIAKQTQGKLNCPKCQSKLGNFTWINSCNCPCGKNISPAFYLVPSKVELTHTVQNVEITV